MPNPKANKPLTLEQIKADAMSMGIPARALLDMIYSGGRSAIATTVGLPADLANTAIGLHNMAHDIRRRKFEGYEPGTIPGGSEDIKGLIPDISKDPNSNLNKMADFGGGFAVIPGSGTAAVKGAKMIGQEIADRVATGRPLMHGAFNEPQMAMHVVKPKGGNWLNNNVEKSLSTLKRNLTPIAEDKEWLINHRADWEAKPPSEQRTRVLNSIDRDMAINAKNEALDNWIEKNLTNYVKKDMGTPEDPVRKLAEEGILHMNPYGTEATSRTMRKRSELGYPAQGLANSELAKFWERQSDASIDPYPAGSYKHGAMDESLLENNPWLKNVPDETMINSGKGLARGLGFDHILDVLGEDLTNGRLHPDKLKNISMEQAVRRTYEYDQDMAKKMAETALKQTEGFPVVKEYPSGHKWIELTKPTVADDLPSTHIVEPYMSKGELGKLYRVINTETGIRGEGYATPDRAIKEFNKNFVEDKLSDALKYEGDTMGHCVGGYCPDVLQGNTRIFSLRDSRGEPHVTIEVKKSRKNVSPSEFYHSGDVPQSLIDKITEGEKSGMFNDIGAFDDFIKTSPEYHEYLESGTPNIHQIKGKGNGKPVDKYIPMVQDFQRTTGFPIKGDLQNSGFVDTHPELKKMVESIGLKIPDYLTKEEENVLHQQVAPHIESMVKNANDFLDTHPAFEPHRQATREFNDALSKEFSTNEPVYTQQEMNELERRSLQSIHPEFPYHFNEIKKVLNNPEEHGEGDPLKTQLYNLGKIDELRNKVGDVPAVQPQETQGLAKGGRVKSKVFVNDDLDMMRHELMIKPVRKFKDGGQEGEDLSKPAFVYPEMGKRPHQTPESVTQSANAPISALRGSIASGFGFHSDIANLFNNPEAGLPLSPSESKEIFGEKKDLPTTTSSILSVLPLKQTGPVNEAAEALGVAVPFPVGKAVRAGAKMIKEGAEYISPKVAEMIAKGELKIPGVPDVMQTQPSMFVTDPNSPAFEKVIKPEERIKVKTKKAKEPEPTPHTDEQIEEHSFQPASTDEAQKHLSNGHYVYAMHEQAEEPHLLRSADEVNAYTPDQLAIVPKDIPMNGKSLSEAIEDKAVKNLTVGSQPIEGEIKDQPTFIDMKKGDISQHNLMVERGERETGSKSILSAAEKQVIKQGAKDAGVPASEIEAKVRQHKIDNPSTGDDPWAHIELNRIVPNKDKPGDYDIEYKNIPYSFDKDANGKLIEPNTLQYENHTETLAEKLKNEVLEIYNRFKSGDQTAGNIIRQAGWYKEMRSRLRQEFGGLGDTFADLLGATSPNTPVRENWKNAIDLLRKASKGDFDELMPKWESWQENIKDKEKELETWFNEQNQTRTKKEIKEKDPEYKRMMQELSDARKLPDELMPLKDNEKKYGFNGENGIRALTDLFRVVKNPNIDIGIGATAPKAITFSGNLIGFKDRATIDVWAARLLQRLAGKERVPSMAESGVVGSMLPDGTTTGQFGLGQDVFHKAVDKIRTDPNMSQHDILKNISDDDLQALVWFKEKELWTKKNWTSASGEGGSFEQEADLAGIKNQEEVNRLRKMLDTGVAVTPEQKQHATEVIEKLASLRELRSEFQKSLKGLTEDQLDEVKPFLDEFDDYVDALRADRDDNKLNAVLKKPTFDELLESKRGAQQQLNEMSRSLERYQAGLSIQRPEFTPTNKDMASLSNSIKDAIYSSDDGATVMGSKALSTEGRYGDPERSLDLEAVVRDGYDPHPLLHEIVSQANKFNQDSTFLSKVLRHDEVPNPLTHRPGVEIYFREANDVDKLQPILDNLAKEGINFYTVVVDGRRSSEAMAGGMPAAVGVRFQLVPEFEQRYGMFDWSSLNDKQIAERVMNQANEMVNLASTVAQKIPGISDAQQYWYDTEVVFKNQYEERLNEIKNTVRNNQGTITRPGEKVWSGKPIREGVEAATRWAREESGAQGNVLSGNTVGADQVNKSKKLAIGGSVTPGQPRQESFINPSLRLANGQVTLNPLEFMPNYRRGGKVTIANDLDMMRHELMTKG